MQNPRGRRWRPRGSRTRAVVLGMIIAMLVLIPTGMLAHAVAGSWQDTQTRLAGERQVSSLLTAVQSGMTPTAEGGLPFEIVAHGYVVFRSIDVGAFDRDGPIMPSPGEGPAQSGISYWTYTFATTGPNIETVTQGGASQLAGLRVSVVGGAVQIATIGQPGDFPQLAGMSQDTLVRAYVFLTPFATDLLLHRLEVALALAVPLLVGMAGLSAGIAVGRSLRSVERLRLQAVAATAPGSTALVESDTDDELSAMAGVINDNVQRLRESLAAQRQFVADAAHELRNPLSVLISGLEIADRYPSQASWPEVSAQALRSARRLSDLTQDLLILAQLDAGAPERTEQVALRRLCADLIEARGCPRPSVALLDGPEVAVRGDRARLARVVGNLLDNAVRHAATTVSVRLRAEAGQAILDVHNDGPAITTADRERIFERFTRLDEARARDDGGAGLGLAIARDAATRQGGTVTALDLRAGATFRVTLPLTDLVLTPV